MIKIENLRKSYPAEKGRVTALDNISLTIPEREIYGVIGHSGAGKSTLIRCLNLLERPDSGAIKIDGVDITQLSTKELMQARRRIGMIFQHFNLLSSQTVFENIAFPLRLEKMPEKAIEARVDELLTLVGLKTHRDKYPAQLSGGQKQRISIARLFLKNPPILIFDEATSALDNESEKIVQSSLEQLAKNRTTFVIAHRLSTIRNAERIIVLSDDGIEEEGNYEELMALNGKFARLYKTQLDSCHNI